MQMTSTMRVLLSRQRKQTLFFNYFYANDLDNASTSFVPRKTNPVLQVLYANDLDNASTSFVPRKTKPVLQLLYANEVLEERVDPISCFL